MPPGGIHLAAGAAFGRWCPGLHALLPQRHQHAFREALVLGSIVPDYDLVLTAVVVALTQDKRHIDTLHRTVTHSLPLIALALLGQALRLPDTPACAGADSRAWRALLRLSKAAADDTRTGDALAWALGAALGAVLHVLLDIFYVVPVQLCWPHPLQVSYPLLLPPKAQFTNRLYKLAMLGDFFSDNLFTVPLVAACARGGLHEPLWRRYAAFWAFQAAVVVGHLHPQLMSDDYSHEDFIWWLHAPCGLAFILALSACPLLLREGVAVLSTPPALRPTLSTPPPAPVDSPPGLTLSGSSAASVPTSAESGRLGSPARRRTTILQAEGSGSDSECSSPGRVRPGGL